jgi:hypothetical protein
MLSNRPAESLLDLVGQTPMLRVSSKLFFKLEYCTPFRSIADRIVRALIRRGHINGPLRIDVVDPLSVSAIGLTRVHGFPYSRSVILGGDPEFMGAGVEAVRQLLDDWTRAPAHDGLGDRIARYRMEALAIAWAEVAAETHDDLSPGAASPRFVIPELPWMGLGTLMDQLAVARTVLGGDVVLVAVRDQESAVSHGGGIATVTHSQAVSAARRLGREMGATPFLLGGAVAHCCLTSGMRETIVGVLADSAEWHDFALDETAAGPEDETPC